MEIRAPFDNEKSALMMLFKEAFEEDDSFLNLFFDVAYSNERARILLVDGKIASMLYWFDCEFSGMKIAYLYAIATDKSFRGKGLCNALMKDTHEHLLKNGYACAILKPASASLFDFYGKIGYRKGTSLCQFNVKKATQGCEFSKIDAFEYSTLRKSYLPKKSVLQEGKSLEFLSKLACFIKGDDFIMAYSVYDKRLIANEILGNTAMAERILYSLGVDFGTFRCKGDDMPFTMVYPLLDDFDLPDYFAFAFD